MLAGAAALSLTGGCAGSTAPPDEHVGKASQDLDADQCSYFDVNGKDTICHHTGSATHPFTLIKISDQACITGHADHAEDYITSLDPASSLYDPTCNGQGCLPTAAPCDGTLECCTGSCVSGTCVDPCSPNPCQNGGTCAASGSSHTCTCTGGFTGTNCEIPPAPPGPAIGCHDAPGTSGNNGIDDLFYLGPIDTIDNVTFYRAPRDGTCTGDSFQSGAALISAANAAAAATKCESLIPGGFVFDASACV
ncbi:MAG TPA: calcium-binding EGF-like domain-containing protein [Kofleriaceae bacterium]